MTSSIESASAPSVPGRMGTHFAPQADTVSVRLGSMTTISAPRFAAASRRSMSTGGESVAGLVPQTKTISALSMSAKMSIWVRPIVTCGAIMWSET